MSENILHSRADYASLFTDSTNTANINNVAEKTMPLVKKGETEMNELLQELAAAEPGELDQGRLMFAQMTMMRWQMASQLLSNFQAGVGQGLKSTLQNIR